MYTVFTVQVVLTVNPSQYTDNDVRGGNGLYGALCGYRSLVVDRFLVAVGQGVISRACSFNPSFRQRDDGLFCDRGSGGDVVISRIRFLGFLRRRLRE